MHCLHRRSSLYALAFGVALTAAIALCAAPADASFTGNIGTLFVFQSTRDGNAEIYTDLVGNLGFPPPVRLTNNPAADQHPRWSPDGKKIVFDSFRDGNYEIYTMNADGSAQTRITNNAAFDELPSWSPDGTKIVFDSSRDGDTHGEIYTMNADGTGVTRLTNDPNYDFGASWSPDGTKIIWQSSRSAGQYDIYSMNADGTAQTNLTNNPAADIQPNWAPDGSMIAWSTNRSGHYEIWLMKPDGTGAFQRYGTASSLDEETPAFQPDAQTYSGTFGGGIIFTRYNVAHTASDIWRLGTAQWTDGTSLGALDEFPDWQPLNNTYARPKGATPIRISIIPAYKQCVPPSGTQFPPPKHRGAITQDTCYAPAPESSALTVGSPEFNGVGANSIGSVLLRAKATVPEDGLINVSLTDVRCQGTTTGCSGGALSDYSGSLTFSTNFRITDKNNGPTGVGPSSNGTVTDLPFSFAVPCAVTASTTVGSTCSVATSMDAVMGGATAVDDGKRALWELLGFSDGRIFKLNDGSGGLFAVGGLFFP